MEFGIPKLREFKKEKFENDGVLNFEPTGEGKGRKVSFNRKAIEMLGISGENNQISFSFSGNDVYVVNTSGCESCSGLKIGKTTNSFSDKKHYNHIKINMFKQTEESSLELFLEPTTNSFNGNVVFRLKDVMAPVKTVMTAEDAVVEEIESMEVESTMALSEQEQEAFYNSDEYAREIEQEDHQDATANQNYPF